ncbi:MAG: mandelate racemase/muconate lactonizing enzyme family protein [Chloroflexi bacterium]|nr:mandelate racemase/muconate lactonizing enzyme family protein [Chloroflexota bacterium]
MPKPPVRIEMVETFVSENWMIVRIVTEGGIHGVGESTFFGFPQASRAVVEAFSTYLIGKDALQVEHHWLAMFRKFCMRGGAIGGGISAIDQALWDIRGKYFDEPVWQLLGGRVRSKVRAMLMLQTGTIDEVVAEAALAVRDGYTAIKVPLYQHDHIDMRHGRRIDDLGRRAAAVRETVGWDVDMGIEIHRNMVPGEAIVLAAELERLRPYFYEDPIPPDSVISFGEVAQKTRIPMAAGERNLNVWEFREYVEHAGVHYIRPDVGVAGGITHVKKICALAEAHHQGIIPHALPSGPIATAAHVQLGACVPNWEAQEHRPQDRPPHSDVVKRVIKLDRGYLLIPEAPGIGMELDEAGLKKHPFRPFGPEGAPIRVEDESVAMR